MKARQAQRSSTRQGPGAPKGTRAAGARRAPAHDVLVGVHAVLRDQKGLRADVAVKEVDSTAQGKVLGVAIPPPRMPSLLL